MDENELAELATQNGLHGKNFKEVNIALKEALTHAGNNDLIVICGSVFLVGEVNV